MTATQVASMVALMFSTVSALIWWVNKASPDKEVFIAVIGASATVLTAVVVLVLTQADSKAKELREAHRSQKIEVYGEFNELIFLIFSHVKIAPPSTATQGSAEDPINKSQENLQSKSASFSRKLLLWGSPEVMAAWLKFREQAQGASNETSTNTNAGLKTLLAMDAVLRAMRSDLHLSNSGLKDGDLVKSFLTDPGTLDRVLDN
jgi:hypothetical protein